jgi:hypothetical protein
MNSGRTVFAQLMDFLPPDIRGRHLISGDAIQIS